MNPLIIIGNRQTGKTTQLINSMKSGDILVVYNNEMKLRVAETFNLPKKQIITHGEFIKGEELKKLEPTNIYIDDAEWLLRDYLGKHTLKCIVITLEDSKLIEKINQHNKQIRH